MSPQQAEDPWNTCLLDLDAYLARIGVQALPPSREALNSLHAAHVSTLPFENLDVLLDQHPGVTLEAVQRKLLGADGIPPARLRGGYCFEHTVLMGAALDRLGYRVRRKMGRVWDPAGSRNHMVLEVGIPGEPGTFMADPGFGLAPLHPVPLVDGAESDAGGWRFQVRPAPMEEPGWALYRWQSDAWQLQHVHDELPVRPVDVQMAHHYTSTHPSSHFRLSLRLTRHNPDGSHTSISPESVAVRRPGEPTQYRPATPEEVLDAAADIGADLRDDERARLIARWDSIATIREGDRAGAPTSTPAADTTRRP